MLTLFEQESGKKENILNKKVLEAATQVKELKEALEKTRTEFQDLFDLRQANL